MNLTATSIRKPVFAWMIMASLMLFGGIAFTRMGVNLMPSVEFPTISVNVQWEGAAPTAIETDVLDELEDSLAGIAGILNVNSSARTGSGNINLEFGLDKDIDIAMQEVQNAVFRAQRRLPLEVEPPTISKQNPDDQPIIWAAVASETVPRLELMEYVRDHIKNQFSTIDGVSEVFLGGYVDPAVRIWVSQKKLEGLELTVDDVIATVRNESNESPAGRLETKAKELSVRTAGEVNSVEELAKLPILRRGGAPLFTSLKLGDVVDIEMGSLDVRRLTRSDGTAAIGLGVRKQSGANAVAVAERVKKRIEEIRPTLPPGITIGVRSDSTRFISEAVEELVFTLLLSAILTAVICWLFLGSFRATINVVLAIPTSIFGTFIVCHALGFTLNTFTLLGLSLAIGIVVDDAIMVLENIYRHRAMNKSSPQAAYDGTKEVAFAAMAATAAIAAIFLPIAYMEGIIGRFLFEFGITISVAVGFSLLEALTLTPMRCALIKDHTNEHVGLVERAGNVFFDALARVYRAVLGPVLRFRWLVLLASVAMFAATIYLFPLLKKELVPAQDQDMLMLRLQAPTGSTLQYTDEKSREIESILAARPEVKQTFVSIGGFGGSEVDTGMIFITLHPKGQRPSGPEGKKLSQAELASTLRDTFKEIKGIRANVIDPSISGGIGGGGRGRSLPINIAIVGDNWDKLIDATNKITEEMESSGTFVDIDSNFRPGLPEIVVEPDRVAAARRGVSIADIDRTVSVLVGGSTIGQLTRDGRRFDIRLRLQENELQSIEVFRKIFVRNNRGENVRLADVATIKEQQSLQSIFRKNRERSISLYSNLARGVAQTDGMTQLDAIAAKHLPQGYRVIREGTSQSLDESMVALQFALIMGILVAYMILASQFNSFIDPITILAALPFSLTGALAALWFTGHTINIFSVIGIVLLMGIVKKNSILLVDFTNQVRDQGKDVRDALLVACPLRLRPILMTSIATICGILPAALAIGPGSESRAPMAIALLGGVTVSTVLTLIVVPALYYVVSGRKRRVLKFREVPA